MMAVGVVEIAVGVGVLAGRARLFGWVAAGWLLAIAVNLLTTGRYLDVAARDVALAVSRVRARAARARSHEPRRRPARPPTRTPRRSTPRARPAPAARRPPSASPPVTPPPGRGLLRAMKGPAEQGTFLVAERKARIDEVVAERTRTLTVVMEAFCDPQNVNAVLRTCEAFGVQELHVVEGPMKAWDRNKKISQNADKWLDVHRWRSSADCLGHLRAQGFAIYATHLGGGTRALGELSFAGKVALVFGNERRGVSDEAVRAPGRDVRHPDARLRAVLQRLGRRGDHPREGGRAARGRARPARRPPGGGGGRAARALLPARGEAARADREGGRGRGPAGRGAHRPPTEPPGRGQARAQRSQKPARSGGSGVSSRTRSPVRGCGSSRRQAWSAWRGEPQERRGRRRSARAG